MVTEPELLPQGAGRRSRGGDAARRGGGAGAKLRRRGVHLWTQEVGEALVFLPLASGKGEGGLEGGAGRICCTQGFAKHMTSAKAGSASAQVRKLRQSLVGGVRIE